MSLYSRKIPWFWVGVGVFALNLLLKILYLDTVPVGLDEPFTIFHAQMPVGEMLSELAGYNNPPLFELILNPWIKWFGNGPFAVRFPSMLFSSLAAVGLFAIGLRLRSGWAGLVAALLFTFSTEHIYYAHEARVYALWTLLTVASIYGLFRWREQAGGWSWWIFWTLCNVLLIYAHYFGAVLVVLQAFWLLVFPHPEKRTMVVRMFLTGGLMTLAYLPQLGVMWNRMGHAGSEHWVGPARLEALYGVFAAYCNQPVVAVTVLLVLLATAVFVWAGHRLEGAGFGVRLWLLILLFPGAYVAMWLVGLRVPVFLDRYLVFVTPALYLLLGMAAFHWSHVRGGRWLGILLVGMVVATVRLAPGKKSQWDQVAQLALAEKTPDTSLLIVPAWNQLAFVYHYQRDWFSKPDQTLQLLEEEHIYGVKKHTRLDKVGHLPGNRLILVRVPGFQDQLHSSIQMEMDAQFRLVQNFDKFHGIDFLLFERIGQEG